MPVDTVDISTIKDTLHILSLLGGGLIFFLGLWWKLSKMMAQFTTKLNDLEKKVDAQSKKTDDLSGDVTIIKTQLDERQRHNQNNFEALWKTIPKQHRKHSNLNML